MDVIKGGPNKACAACKYQRKRCSQDCPLAAYFPADKPKMFCNAHRLYGVSNIMRILNQINKEHRDDAMKSIIFESDIRAKFPVHGCYGITAGYIGVISKLRRELHQVKMLLALCKQRYHQNCQSQQFLPLNSMDQYQTGVVQFPNPTMYSNDVVVPYNFDQNRASSSTSSYANNVMDQERYINILGDRYYGGGPYIDQNQDAMMNASSSFSYAHVLDQERFKVVNGTLKDTKPDQTTMQVDVANPTNSSTGTRHAELGGVISSSDDAMQGNPNLMLRDGVFYEQQARDEEFPKIDMIEKERLSSDYYNALVSSEYDDIFDVKQFMDKNSGI